LVKRIQWTPLLVNKFWDGVAQTELDSLSFGKVAGPQFLELVNDYLVQGRTYLDFGAGSGHMLSLLLDRGLSAAGFEPSTDRQALLLEKIGQHKNFLGVKGADSNEQFDVVLLMEVVEHVLDEDFSSVLARVASFVKPGGYLVVSTPNNENLDHSSVYCPVSDSFFHPWQHVRSFTPLQLSECFRKIGFSTDFLATVDFSADADLIESYKKNVAIDKIKESSLNQLLKSVETSFEEYRIKMNDLGRLDRALKAGVQLGFWQKIKLRFDVLRRHRSFIASLHTTAHDIAHRFDELAAYVLAELHKTTQLEPQLEEEQSRSDKEVDLRLGRETTILYVGKKNAV
jgi:SAM-dependent methyltransferase